jgi:hypothetical protein
MVVKKKNAAKSLSEQCQPETSRANSAHLARSKYQTPRAGMRAQEDTSVSLHAIAKKMFLQDNEKFQIRICCGQFNQIAEDRSMEDICMATMDNKDRMSLLPTVDLFMYFNKEKECGYVDLP